MVNFSLQSRAFSSNLYSKYGSTNCRKGILFGAGSIRLVVTNGKIVLPSSRRSASSMTRYLILAKLNVELFSSWSASRPGVAITMWGRPLSRSRACSTESLPPTTTQVLSPIPTPTALNWSAIWKASSRVGVNTRA